MTDKILIIDDEADIRDILGDILDDEGYEVLKAAHSEQALSYIKTNDIALVILDIWLENSDMDGIEILKFLKSAKSAWKDVPVLMISGHGNVEMAVNAMKMGAYDFIEKPFKIDHMLLTVTRALEQGKLRQENSKLKTTVGIESNGYATKSVAMNSVLRQLSEHTASDARVLIKGEVGTGKSKFARYIHSISPRANNPLHIFSAQNLTAQDVEQFFHDANFKNSTIIIEKINRLPAAVQSCFYKELSQARDTTIPRFISTAPNGWETKIESEGFSAALFDRLAVLVINLPSLAKRLEDIPELVKEFSTQVAVDMNYTQVIAYGTDAILNLQERQWPGNIRQLKCTIEWITLNHSLGEQAARPISAGDVEMFLVKSEQALPLSSLKTNPQTSDTSSPSPQVVNNLWLDQPLRDARDQFEKQYLTAIIKRFHGNISQMAAHVEMERTALHRKLKSMDIRYETVLNESRQNERAAG